MEVIKLWISIKFTNLLKHILAFILQFQCTSTFTCNLPINFDRSQTQFNWVFYLHNILSVVISCIPSFIMILFAKYQLLVIVYISPYRISRTTIFAQISTFVRISQIKLFDWLISFYVTQITIHLIRHMAFYIYMTYYYTSVQDNI